MMMTGSTSHARVLIIGGGSAGISVAARLQRAGEDGIVLVEPSDVHYYQPAWSLVAAGIVPLDSTVKPEAHVVPSGVAWVRTSATGIDVDSRTARLANGSRISYDVLVLASGIELHWDGIPGLQDALRTDHVTSNYSFDLPEKTWRMIRELTSGTAVFTIPTGLVKCPSAGQKIAYLAADYWRKKGVLGNIRIILAVPGPRIYGLDEFSDILDGVAADYGIEVRTETELVDIDSAGQRITLKDLADESTETIHYDALHVVPPQSAAAWIAESGLSDGSPGGWVNVDPKTLQHPEHPEIFALGDNANTPNGKTGSAVRDQVPVVARNVSARLRGAQPREECSGYAACPITVGDHKVFLAAADYSRKYTPNLPFMKVPKPRRSMWLLKRYGLGPPVLARHARGTGLDRARGLPRHPGDDRVGQLHGPLLGDPVAHPVQLDEPVVAVDVPPGQGRTAATERRVVVAPHECGGHTHARGGRPGRGERQGPIPAEAAPHGAVGDHLGAVPLDHLGGHAHPGERPCWTGPGGGEDEFRNHRELEETHVPGPQQLVGDHHRLEERRRVGHRDGGQRPDTPRMSAGDAPRHRSTPVMPHHVGVGQAGRVEQRDHVTDQLRHPVRASPAGPGGGAVAALVERDRAEPVGVQQRRDTVPAGDALREAVQEDDRLAVHRARVDRAQLHAVPLDVDHRRSRLNHGHTPCGRHARGSPAWPAAPMRRAPAGCPSPATSGVRRTSRNN